MLQSDPYTLGAVGHHHQHRNLADLWLVLESTTNSFVPRISQIPNRTQLEYLKDELSLHEATELSKAKDTTVISLHEVQSIEPWRASAAPAMKAEARCQQRTKPREF